MNKLNKISLFALVFFTAFIQFSIDVNAAPGIPQPISAHYSCGSNGSDSRVIVVSARTAPGAVYYYLYLKNDSGSFEQIAGNSVPSFVYRDGRPGELKTFKMKSMQNIGNVFSEFSPEVSQRVPFSTVGQCEGQAIIPPLTTNSLVMTSAGCRILAGESTCRATKFELNGNLYGYYNLVNNTTRKTSFIAFGGASQGYYQHNFYGFDSPIPGADELKHGVNNLTVQPWSGDAPININLASITLTASCDTGSIWNGSKCFRSVNVNNTVSNIKRLPNFSGTSGNYFFCTIPASKSSCKINYLTWQNATFAGSIKSYYFNRNPNITTYNESKVISNQISRLQPVPIEVMHGPTEIFNDLGNGYNYANPRVKVFGMCKEGSGWDGEKCNSSLIHNELMIDVEISHNKLAPAPYVDPVYLQPAQSFKKFGLMNAVVGEIIPLEMRSTIFNDRVGGARIESITFMWTDPKGTTYNSCAELTQNYEYAVLNPHLSLSGNSSFNNQFLGCFREFVGWNKLDFKPLKSGEYKVWQVTTDSLGREYTSPSISLNVTASNPALNILALRLRPNPIFLTTVMSSDTLILQLIMKTDSLIFKGNITGLMDAETIDGVIKLRARYGIPYVNTKGQTVDMASLMNAQTVALITRILAVNNSSTVIAGLLSNPNVSPANINLQAGRLISSVRATKDFLLGRTSVVVIYADRKRENFVIPLIKPEATLTDRIAAKLNRPVTDLAGKLSYASLNGEIVDKIEMTLKPRNKKEVDFNFTKLDESVEFRRVTPDEANQAILFFFGGDEERFAITVDGYIEDVRQGGVSEDLITFVSVITGETKAKVRSILTVKLEVYPDDGGGA